MYCIHYSQTGRSILEETVPLVLSTEDHGHGFTVCSNND